MANKRILIVDDNAKVRKDLHTLLQLMDQVEIIGEAANGEGAIQQVLVLNPDIVIIDPDMPGNGGYEAIRQIKAIRSKHLIIALTIRSDHQARQRALDAGADMFFVKGDDVLTMLESVRLPSPIF